LCNILDVAGCTVSLKEAMLSQIGYLSLPPPLLEKLYYGEPLTPTEKTLAAGVPDVWLQPD